MKEEARDTVVGVFLMLIILVEIVYATVLAFILPLGVLFIIITAVLVAGMMLSTRITIEKNDEDDYQPEVWKQ